MSQMPARRTSLRLDVRRGDAASDRLPGVSGASQCAPRICPTDIELSQPLVRVNAIMSIGSGSAVKRLVQSSIRASSQLFARPATEVLLSGAAAYINAICGLGWSPSLELEAKNAAAWIAP